MLPLHQNRTALAAAALLSALVLGACDSVNLEGKVFVERLSRLKQQRILAKLKKQMRQAM